MDVRANRFLEGFTPDGREKIVANLIHQELDAGQFLFHEGDKAEGVCLVLDGHISTFKSAGTHEQILASFFSNDFLGEIGVLDGEGRSASARAVTKTAIAWIPSPELFEVLAAEPVGVTPGLFRSVIGLLRKTNELYLAEVVHKEKLGLIGEMASTLMHDIRNPVQVILSSLELMKMTHGDSETVDCCQKMELQCDRLIAMAGELLEFSRGETKLHLARTDTETLIRQFLSYNEESLHTSGIAITAETEPADLEVDSMRILRALQNLVNNAAQALGNKPGAAIDVRAWVADSILHLTVRDNGSGIPPEVRERLFEPFVTFGKKGGTGLGLAIVKNIVQAHRGQITVTSQPGQGTEFFLRLPQDKSSATL